MININPKQTGKIIAELRKNKGESQEELARNIGVTGGSVAHYEVGRRMPSDEIKVKIARHFGVPVQDIFYRNDDEEYEGLPPDLEVREMAEKMANDDGLRVLFNTAKNATKEDLQIVTDVAKRMFGD